MFKHLLLNRLSALPIAVPLLALTMLASPLAYAQQDTGMEEIENMFSNDETIKESPSAPSVAPGNPAAPKADAKTDNQNAIKMTEIKDVSDLGKLQEFRDIAVISRRFLPKSQRWELYLAPALNLNDAFFLNFGVQGRAGYYFNERYGIEGIFTFLTSSDRASTTELREARKVQTTAFVTSTSFYGADFKWIPIYGKMSWRNQKITPFDLYFSAGLGMTGTNQDSTDITLHLGTGQAFALSKSQAVRWDFSWYSYQAQSKIDHSTSNYNNLMFTIGWSWFFPEATYR